MNVEIGRSGSDDGRRKEKGEGRWRMKEMGHKGNGLKKDIPPWMFG